MTRQIEFWFDFSSPYGYFASETVEHFGAETGHAIVWRPFLLGAIFTKTNMTPLAETPMRGSYARHDWQRVARLIGVPFHLPQSHPFAATKASRAYYWIEAITPKSAPAFVHGIFRAHFAEGRDPSDPAVIADVAETNRIDSAALLRAIETDEMKSLLRQKTDEAAARNIFGSPFFMVDGEPFWGWDRMPMMRDWIEHGGW